MKRRSAFLALLILLVLALLGGGIWWFLHPAAGPLRLRQASFAEIPGWGQSDTKAALTAFQRSCVAFAAKPETASLGSYAGTVADWRPVCAAAKTASLASARSFFEQWFSPLTVSAGRLQAGRFTGYYEPEIRGSRFKHDAYQIPVYGRPDDLVTVDLGTFRPALKGERIAGHVQDGKLVPYASRAEIAAKGLNAPVLFYTDDPIELFFLHIQGSGRVTMEDGSKARVAYAAQNGQPYTAIGKTLIARGVPREGMSLQVIRAWLRAHPKEAQAVMNRDASYVFFTAEQVGDAALGAKGAQGVPLTPLASLAVDSRLHELGTPFFVAGAAPLGRLLIAQDIGGAIRGVVRGDVYFGVGPEAEEMAGTMNQMGRLYALLPKPVVQHLAQSGALK